MAGAAETLGRLKGRKAVFSNGPSFYVRALVQAIGIAHHLKPSWAPMISISPTSPLKKPI